MDITLSDRCIKLIYQLKKISNTELFQLREDGDNTTIDRTVLVAWLDKKDIGDQCSKFLLESLRAVLLENLLNSFSISEAEKKEKPVAWYAKLIFSWLIFSGTIVAACEGFEGVAAVLGMFTAVPAVVVFTAGLTFSALSVFVFYSFDLVAISKNLGIKITSSPQFIDVLLEQVEQIELLRQRIDDCYAKTSSLDELAALKQMVSMLAVRYAALDEARSIYKIALNSPYLAIAKSAIAAITGILFLAGGFFTGQSLAVAVAGLFMTPVSALFLPILLTSTVVGAAAVSLYWYVERPGVENLVAGMFGLDMNSVDKLTNDAGVKEQKRMLNSLIAKIEQIETMKVQLQSQKNTTSAIAQINIARESNVNRNTFFKRSKSMNDLPGLARDYSVSYGSPAV